MLSTANKLIGQQLAGYRLLELLGRGGMSLVFVAERVDQPQQQVASASVRHALYCSQGSYE
jgi:hypothetical protein